mmetsp:Transcript_39480/g.124237  ORF Transcript_39480/g.124237 Transcript_39480/m.124237 type:complete len:270 (+) Transcript_39480:917-1726(+)
MKEQRMAYPLSYGYSLVGRVIGSGVSAREWEGKRLFSFSPHSSHAIVSANGAMLVPEHISDEDACYFPAVETALSLVQDARPMVGERVAVFGQGMIGLLVSSILVQTVGPEHVVAVELDPARAALARRMGVKHVLTPAELQQRRLHIDLSIEVTGNPRGLQAALDHTARGGRVLLGSWYGSKPAQLLLGINFHRSQLSIKCSQVSQIAADLSGLWSKQRRFDEAWTWVGRIRPSLFLSSLFLPLEQAQEGYSSLDQQKPGVVGVQFVYK